MTKVLVTGAAGFIGSHLVEHLANSGFKVKAMVRYNSRSTVGNLEFLDKKLLNKIEIIRGDVKDPEFCSNAVQDCKYIFHLAALIGIPYSYVNPYDYVQVNVNGTMNLLNAARRNNVKRFVHTSTSEVYGTALYTPIDEKHPLQAQSPYSASKIAADKLVESYYLSFNLPITIIRPFNNFGPRQSARAVIPTIVSQLYKYDEVKIGSLEPKRDFLFVKDCVEGFLEVGLHKNTMGETINLGTGKDFSIGEIYESCCKLMNKENKLIKDKTRIRPAKSEVMWLLANADKAKELTKWEPKYTFEEGLKETIEWIGKNLSLYDAESYLI